MKLLFNRFLVIFTSIVLVLNSVIFANIINQNDSIANQAQVTIETVSAAINKTHTLVDSFNNSNLHYGTISFGSYPQNYSLDDKSPIEWYLLEKREDKVILMSKYVLDVHRYDNKINSNWKDTSISKFLNGTFYDTAFNNSEKQMIISNPYKSVGNVFLLNLSEAEGYFSKSDTSISSSEFTTYANSQKTSIKNSYWLDASNGVSSLYVKDYYDGNNKYLDLKEKLGVRPCIVLKYNAQNTNNTSVANKSTTTNNVNIDNNSPIYIADVQPDIYTYGYDDDNDNHYNMQITIKHPIFASGNQLKAQELNNLYNLQAKEIVKVNTNDFIDENHITNKQILINATDFHKEDDYNYTITYVYGASKTMFKLHINLATNQCFIEFN